MNTYTITDFGAWVCDGLQTPYIQKAIDTCFLNGGGRVTIPRGIFRTGGIRLRSNVTLYLQTGAASVRSRWNNAIIRAVRAKNVAIIEEPGSYVNGRNCSDTTGEEGYRLTCSLTVIKSGVATVLSQRSPLKTAVSQAFPSRCRFMATRRNPSASP